MAVVAGQAGFIPPGNKHVNFGFFDPKYPSTNKTSEDYKQHLGVDLRAIAGTPILSNCNGHVITNYTGVMVEQSYVVIKSDRGYEFVFGHIRSDLKPNQRIKSGELVGFIKSNPAEGDHLHFGLNIFSVARASGVHWTQKWGWGKAPGNETVDHALALGWRDPLKMPFSNFACMVAA